MFNYKKWITASISTLILLFAVSAFAAITGTISGTVTDATGAVVPNVTVTVLNQDTGIVQTKVTDGRGFFSFPALDVGTYTVGVSQTGFDAYKEQNIKIDANSDVRADVILKVGSVTQVTEVTANPVQIETQSSQLGEVIESTKMTDVPLNGRSFTDLMLLQPGVSPYSGKSESSSSEPAVSGSLNGGSISVNGGRESSNGYMVNGADVNDGVENSTAVIPNLDSIGEFRIITDNFSAEYGNFSGGQVNVVTKSGTNKFHGSGFEFMRNTDFNARNYYSATVAPYVQNIWGGTAGGPIKKDKLFFFADFQGTNTTQAQVENVQTLSAADLTGNVAEGAALMDTNSNNNYSNIPYAVNGTGWASVLSTRLAATNPGGVNNGEPYYYTATTTNPITGLAYGSNCTTTTYNAALATGCVFPGATIPKAAWDPVAPNLFKYIPAPNATGSSILPNSNYVGGVVPTYSNSSLATTTVDKKFSGRGDLNTRYGTFFVYYFMDQFNILNPYGGGSDGEFPSSTKGRTMLSNVGLTTTFKNNSVNSARISYMRSNYYSGSPDFPLGTSLSSLGFLTPWGPAGGISPIDASLQTIPETSVEGIGMGLPDAVVGHREGTFQGLDNYMKVVGTHTLTFGASYHFDLITERNNDENNGSFSFGDSTTETGFGAADFLLGAVSNGFTQSSDQYEDARSYYFGTFAEDSWRAKPNLTLNYGIRYEITTPWWDTKNRIETIIQGQQSKVFPNAPLGWDFPTDAGVPKTLAYIKYNKFAPRFGFAYTPDGTGPLGKLFGGPNHTSIRGGFGLFYTSYQQMSVYQEAGDAPFGNYYTASNPSLLYAPYVTRNSNSVTSQPFPFNWPPADVSVAHPFTGFNFANAGAISGSPGVEPYNTVPYVEEYNLSIQRQLNNDTVFTISYVGSEGKHLANGIPANEGTTAACAALNKTTLAPGQTACGPNLETQTYTLANGSTVYGTRFMNIACGCIGFGSDNSYVTEGVSNYNSLQTQLKHSSKTYDFLLGYTWARSMDNDSSLTGTTNNLYPNLAYGMSGFNVPQYFVGSYTVHLPFANYVSNHVAKYIVGGWGFSGITKLAKGTPLKISNSGDKSETATNFDVPFYTPGNLFAGGPTQGDKNPRHGNLYFNKTLFTAEKTGQFGNTYRDFFVGPGLIDTDLTLQRYFQIHEAHQVEFRAEAFNVFNHTNFGNPGTSVTSGTFGKISSAGAARILQLAWKYNF